MVREDREARERLGAEATDEAYMEELRRQHPQLMEAERMIFADADDDFIMLTSSDEVEGSEDGGGGGGGGGEDEEIDVEEWRSVFPDDPDEATTRTQIVAHVPNEEGLARPRF
ncbi:Zinc finger protein CONSTANS-LIKE 13 [Hordeum vulgare]|nr:Zinc finger protein CONSTANS-LIKE 13 [Hordeum vulgare]